MQGGPGSDPAILVDRVDPENLLRLNRNVGVFAALAFADMSTYVVTSTQLGLAFPDPVSGIGGSVVKFLGLFALSQVPLAIAEGILGVLVFRLLVDVAQPELERLGVLHPAQVVGAR